MAPPTIEPMLAGYGLPAGPLARWAAEPKLDGWRALVTVTGGEVAATSRRGRPLHLPELDPLAGVGIGLVLDGEVVHQAGRMVDFYAVAPALARRHRRETLTFAAFDVLAINGTSTVTLPYSDRRRAPRGARTTGAGSWSFPAGRATTQRSCSTRAKRSASRVLCSSGWMRHTHRAGDRTAGAR